MAAFRHPSESALQRRLRQVKTELSSLPLLDHRLQAELLLICISAPSQGLASTFFSRLHCNLLLSTKKNLNDSYWAELGGFFFPLFGLFHSNRWLFATFLVSWQFVAMHEEQHIKDVGCKRPRRHKSLCLNSEGRLVWIDRLCCVCSETFWLKKVAYRWDIVAPWELISLACRLLLSLQRLHYFCVLKALCDWLKKNGSDSIVTIEVWMFWHQVLMFHDTAPKQVRCKWPLWTS